MMVGGWWIVPGAVLAACALVGLLNLLGVM